MKVIKILFVFFVGAMCINTAALLSKQDDLIYTPPKGWSLTLKDKDLWDYYHWTFELDDVDLRDFLFISIWKGECKGRNPKGMAVDLIEQKKGFGQVYYKQFGYDENKSGGRFIEPIIKIQGATVAAVKVEDYRYEVTHIIEHFISFEETDTCWNISYMGQEPYFSQYKEEVLESFKSMQLK